VKATRLCRALVAAGNAGVVEYRQVFCHVGFFYVCGGQNDPCLARDG